MPSFSKSKLSENELKICRRLRQIRETYRYSLSGFAALFGLNKDRMASYEYGRAPIRYRLADEVCAYFELNQRWFYSGALPVQYYMRPSKELSARINFDDLFSTVYRNQLSTLIEAKLSRIAKILNCSVPDTSSHPEGAFLFTNLDDAASTAKDLHRALSRWIEWHTRLIPPELHQKYFQAIVERSESFMEEHADLVDSYRVQEDLDQQEPFLGAAELFKAVRWLARENRDDKGA